MDTIKIEVSVKLNLSEDVKNFVASLVSNSSKPALATPAPAKQAAPAKPAPAPVKRPNLTLHTNNSHRAAEMKIKIFMPQRFDDVREVADALKAKNSAIVNYERVELPEQQRICDFLNGVCYVQDGFVHRISNTMVLYAPEGVEINEMKSVAPTATL